MEITLQDLYVYEVNNLSTFVSGKSKVGSTVEVKQNGSVIGTGEVGTDGRFSVKILVQKAGHCKRTGWKSL